MILLLDAHALVWWLADAPRLSPVARGAIADPANDVVVSAATIWELAIKRSAGKITLADNLAVAIEAAGFSGVPGDDGGRGGRRGAPAAPSSTRSIACSSPRRCASTRRSSRGTGSSRPTAHRSCRPELFRRSSPT